MSTWATIDDDVPGAWPDGTKLPPTHVQRCLDAAQDACEAFAPALPAGDEPPAGWVLAVVYQAREIHNASESLGGQVVVGDAAYAIRVPPLAGYVKALLRPQHGIPEIG